IRLLNSTIQNTQCMGLQGAMVSGEIRNNKIIGPGTGPNCRPGPHAIYSLGQDLIIDSNEIVGWTLGYSIHAYSTSGHGANRGSYSNNYIHDGDAGIVLGAGQNQQAFGNVIVYGTGPGITLGYSGNASKVYNNTIVGNKGACVLILNSTWDDGSGLSVV